MPVHEYPLSTVQLNLQLLREDLDPDNPAYTRIVNRLNTVQQETTRLRETLEELGIRARAKFHAAGGRDLQLIPCLNEAPEWIAALAEISARAGP